MNREIDFVIGVLRFGAETARIKAQEGNDNDNDTSTAYYLGVTSAYDHALELLEEAVALHGGVRS